MLVTVLCSLSLSPFVGFSWRCYALYFVFYYVLCFHIYLLTHAFKVISVSKTTRLGRDDVRAWMCVCANVYMGRQCHIGWLWLFQGSLEMTYKRNGHDIYKIYTQTNTDFFLSLSLSRFLFFFCFFFSKFSCAGTCVKI